MRLKVGDRVFYTSGRHRLGTSNPLLNTKYECVGTVITISGSGTYRSLSVKWDNGMRNTYSDKDLINAGEAGRLNPNAAFRMKKEK